MPSDSESSFKLFASHQEMKHLYEYSIMIQKFPKFLDIKHLLYFRSYSTVNETFISFTLTNVEFRKSHDFFAWILRGSSVGFAWN